MEPLHVDDNSNLRLPGSSIFDTDGEESADDAPHARFVAGTSDQARQPVEGADMLASAMMKTSARDVLHTYLKERLSELYGDAHGSGVQKARMLDVKRQFIDTVEKGGKQKYTWKNMEVYAARQDMKASQLFRELSEFAFEMERQEEEREKQAMRPTPRSVPSAPERSGPDAPPELVAAIVSQVLEALKHKR